MFVLGVASRWEGEGGGGHAVRCRIGTELEQIGIIYSKAFSLHTLSQIVQQMANKLLHVLFPYKVSKITQHRKNTTPILSFK